MAFQYQTHVDHSILFTPASGTAKDTWKDWRIVPTTRPVVNPPEANIIMDMIPGATEALDTSEAVGNMVTYGIREGSWEFQVINKTLWSTVYSTIMNFLQGKLMKVTLTDDPGYYYTGRCQVNQWQSEPDASRITIDYKLNPYKYSVQSSEEDWKWDPFSFIDGVIRSGYRSITVDGTQALVVAGTAMPVSPTYQVTLTNTNPSITWTQGTITGGSDAESSVNVRTGLFTGRCYVTPGAGMQCAIAVYDSSGTYQGYLQSNGSVGANAYWSANRVYTPTGDTQYRVICRYTGGTADIVPANASNSSSGVKIRACMTVRAGSGTNYPLTAGSASAPDIVLGSGNTTLTFVGTGTVTVKYRGGSL